MSDDLLAGLRARDRERWLAMLWAGAAGRRAGAAVLALDLELERVVAEAREPMVAEIRLAWWREQLAAMAAGHPLPAEPLLRVLAEEAQAGRVDPVALFGLEDALWPLLCEGEIDLVAIAGARGACLADALCRAAGERPSPPAQAAGARVAFARFARRAWGQAGPLVNAGLEGWPAAAAPFAEEAGALPRGLAALDAAARLDLAALRRGRRPGAPATLRRQWAMARAALGLSFTPSA